MTIRAKIIVEATALFSQRGFHGTSIRDIAQACGVSNPALYYHFENKEALYQAVLLEATQAIANEVDGLLSARAPFADLLSQYFALHFERVVAAPNLARTLVAACNSVVDNPVPTVVAEVTDSFDSKLERLIALGVERGELRPDVDVESTTQIVSGTLRSVVADYLNQKTDTLDTKKAYTLARYITAGVGAEEQEQ